MSLCMTTWKTSCEKLKFLPLCGHLKAIMWVFPLVLTFQTQLIESCLVVCFLVDKKPICCFFLNKKQSGYPD